MELELKKNCLVPHKGTGQKIPPAMKIAFVFLFSMLVNLQTTKAYAQSEVVSLNFDQVTIEKVLNALEHQSGLYFVYNSKRVNVDRVVSIHLNRKPLKTALDSLFNDGKVTYEIEKTHIVLAPVNIQKQSGSSKTQHLTGKIKDATGEPLIGVSVALKDAQGTGTITDMNGAFSLNVPEQGKKLLISYVGYLTQESTIGNKTNFDITLKEDIQNLNEVIVVGYGTTTKRAMISSVSTVKAREMQNLPIANVTEGLAGRAPGLIIQQSGGGVNKSTNVSIRGGATPLVVIDGVIRDYSDFERMSGEDIETISILKDASATAVYGSRASNGILQVSTKQGKVGKPQIDYSFNQMWSQPSILVNKLNSHDYAYYFNEALRSVGQDQVYTTEDLRLFADGSDPYGHPNTDWRKLTLRNFAPTQKHNLTINGGTDVNQYYISIGYLDQNSLYKNNNHYMKRTNFQLGETITFKEIGLKATAQLDGYLQKKTHPSTSTAQDYGGVFSHIQNTKPYKIGVNSLGLPYQEADNPISETAADAGYKHENSSVANGLLNLEWSVPWVEGLTLRAKGNYRFYLNDNKNWRKDGAQYGWDSQEPVYGGKPQLSQDMETGRSWTVQYFALYDKTFKKHSISALAGFEASYGSAHKMSLSRDTYEFDIDQIKIGPEAGVKNDGSEWENGRAAWIGQVKYNYDNRYFAEGSIRYDGSDNFPTNKRWGAFFSASLGWSLGDEAFMEYFRDHHILDMFKIRASYGQTGLDNWGADDDPYHLGRFSYLPSYSISGTSYVVDGKYVAGFSEGELPSSYISWFTTNQFDLGFDFSALNNRLYGSVDYFYYQTKGFLYAPNALNVGYNDPLGKSLPKVKTNGEHRRAGFELQLGWRDNIGDFSYDASFNVTKFDQLWANKPDESLENIKNPYKRESQQTGYKGIYNPSLGFYTSSEDVYNSPKRNGSYDLVAGDIKYYDFNGDGVIDDSDKTRLGKNGFPRANYGVNLSGSYKGFSLSILFQGASRYDILMGSILRLSGETPFYDYQTNYWAPNNTDAIYPRLLSSQGLNGNNNMLDSDFWLINGAYLRMKDIRIGYDFKKLLSKINWLTRLNVGVSGQNIFTLSESTKYGIDPELSNADGYGYPNERVFAININIGF